MVLLLTPVTPVTTVYCTSFPSNAAADRPNLPFPLRSSSLRRPPIRNFVFHLTPCFTFNAAVPLSLLLLSLQLLMLMELLLTLLLLIPLPPLSTSLERLGQTLLLFLLSLLLLFFLLLLLNVVARLQHAPTLAYLGCFSFHGISGSVSSTP